MRNKLTLREKMHTLQLNFRIFQYIGMWRPVVWSTGWKPLLYNFYSIYMILSFYTFGLSQFIELIVASHNINDFAHSSLFLAILAGCGKCASILKHRKDIIRLANVLKNDLSRPRNNDEMAIQIAFERDARSNTLWYTSIAGTTACLISLRSVLTDTPARKMPFEGWLPFDRKLSGLVYWLVYTNQLIAHASFAMINCSFDTLVTGFVQSICAQMKILKYRIETLPETITTENENDSFDRNANDVKPREYFQSREAELLTRCVKHHVQIFQLANSFSDIFSNMVFFQIALSSLILCVSAYEISAMKLFSPEFTATMMYLCCMTVQIFLYCFYGGELTLQSVGICDAAYRMDWSRLDIKTKKSILVIMLRSLRPITFICGNIITVSLDSFNSIVKLSYSVFNVLQQQSETA